MTLNLYQLQKESWGLNVYEAGRYAVQLLQHPTVLGRIKKAQYVPTRHHEPHHRVLSGTTPIPTLTLSYSGIRISLPKGTAS